MGKFKRTALWILSETLLILGIAFIASLFGIFCLILSIILFPLEEWQDILKKIFNVQIRTIIIFICIGIVIAKFPYFRLAAGINRMLYPPPTSDSFSGDYEKHPDPDINISTSSEKTSSINTSTSHSSSSTNEVTSQNVTSKAPYETSSKAPNNNSVENIEYVYRTPSGKRYHLSPSCGGKNSYETPFEDAELDNLTPCQKCASDSF